MAPRGGRRPRSPSWKEIAASDIYKRAGLTTSPPLEAGKPPGPPDLEMVCLGGTEPRSEEQNEVTGGEGSPGQDRISLSPGTPPLPLETPGTPPLPSHQSPRAPPLPLETPGPRPSHWRPRGPRPSPPTGAPGPAPPTGSPAPVRFRRPRTLFPASGFHQKTRVGPRPTHLPRGSPGLHVTSSL